jgi:hypothetical protein
MSGLIPNLGRDLLGIVVPPSPNQLQKEIRTRKSLMADDMLDEYKAKVKLDYVLPESGTRRHKDLGMRTYFAERSRSPNVRNSEEAERRLIPPRAEQESVIERRFQRT